MALCVFVRLLINLGLEGIEDVFIVVFNLLKLVCQSDSIRIILGSLGEVRGVISLLPKGLLKFGKYHIEVTHVLGVVRAQSFLVLAYGSLDFCYCLRYVGLCLWHESRFKNRHRFRSFLKNRIGLLSFWCNTKVN